MSYIILILINPVSESSCPEEGAVSILEEPTPNRIEMFNYRIKATDLQWLFLVKGRVDVDISNMLPKL